MILCYLYFQKIEGYFFTFSPPTSFSKKNNYITIKILQIVSNNVRSSSQGGRSHILYCVVLIVAPLLMGEYIYLKIKCYILLGTVYMTLNEIWTIRWMASLLKETHTSIL